MAKEKVIKEIEKKAKKEANRPQKVSAKPAGKPKTVKEVEKRDIAPNQTVRGFAVIETGGKQYKVAVGDSIKIEKLAAKASSSDKNEYKEGDSVVFEKVLLVDDGSGATMVGTPYLEGAKVEGKIVEIGRNKKVTVIKYKQKSRYFKKNGHRQPYFRVLIDNIS